jgi:hypothetical protein
MACRVVHWLRDFVADLEIGWINASVEDIEKYHLNLDHVNNAEFRRWVRIELYLHDAYSGREMKISFALHR